MDFGSTAVGPSTTISPRISPIQQWGWGLGNPDYQYQYNFDLTKVKGKHTLFGGLVAFEGFVAGHAALGGFLAPPPPFPQPLDQIEVGEKNEADDVDGPKQNRRTGGAEPPDKQFFA